MLSIPEFAFVFWKGKNEVKRVEGDVGCERIFASVKLRLSVSHDPGEIACEIACNLMMLFAGMLFVGMQYAH